MPRPIKTVNMNEAVRLGKSAQMVFGSRWTWLVIVLLVLAGAAGYLALRQYNDPTRGLRHADQLWDRDENPEAVREYKDLLSRRDPINPDFALIPRTDRLRLYRRVITHEAIYGSVQEARDWISRAWLEGLNFERADFEHPQVFALWEEVIAPLRRDNPERERDLSEEMRQPGK